MYFFAIMVPENLNAFGGLNALRALCRTRTYAEVWVKVATLTTETYGGKSGWG